MSDIVTVNGLLESVAKSTDTGLRILDDPSIGMRKGTLAYEQFERAVSLDPGFVSAWLAMLRASAFPGVWSDYQGMLADTTSHLETIRALAPDSYEAYNGLGIALARQGRVAEAESSFRAAVAIAPQLSAAKDNLRAIGKTP